MLFTYAYINMHVYDVMSVTISQRITETNLGDSYALLTSSIGNMAA